MGKLTDVQAAECYARAERARQQAAATEEPGLKDLFLDNERLWLRLAESHEASARLADFLDKDLVSENSACAQCGIDAVSAGECKACGSQTTINVSETA